MENIELYTYCKSSASYRIRIALAYKGVEYHSQFIDLLNKNNVCNSSDYLKINSQGFVPTLIVGQHAIQQSVAILEYIEEKHPTPPLLPTIAEDRAYVRAITQIIVSDIHPLNNLRILNYIENEMNQEIETKLLWYRHWIKEGFTAIEQLLEINNKCSEFCFGNMPTFADICLVPQVFNANRYECDLSNYPLILGINEHCLALDSFKQAAPGKQADFVR